MPSLSQAVTGQSATKECIYCKEEKPLIAFPKHIHHEDNLDSRCRMCIRGQSQLRARLKRNNPRPAPGPCPICEEHTEKWVLDHCHTTETFRGYICESCNLGLGKFNDDPVRVGRALSYLQEHTS